MCKTDIGAEQHGRVELLADGPDFASCRDLLVEALHYVKDDFCEITPFYPNLSLAYWGMNDLEPAIDCVEKTLRILKDHDFADKEIYWPICFNAALVISSAGDPERGKEILRIPLRKRSAGYWKMADTGPLGTHGKLV